MGMPIPENRRTRLTGDVVPLSHVYAGLQVETLRSVSDPSATDVRCPGCGHWTRGLPTARLAANPNRPLFDPAEAHAIDCACMRGEGYIFALKHAVACICRLRYTLAPLGAPNSGRYQVLGAGHVRLIEPADEPASDAATAAPVVAEAQDVVEPPAPTPAASQAVTAPKKATVKKPATAKTPFKKPASKPVVKGRVGGRSR